MDLCDGRRSPSLHGCGGRAPNYRTSASGPVGKQLSSLSHHSKNSRESLVLQCNRGEAYKIIYKVFVYLMYIRLNKINSNCMSQSAGLLHLICPCGIACMCVGLSGIVNALCVYISVCLRVCQNIYQRTTAWTKSIKYAKTTYFHTHVLYLYQSH